MNFFQNLPIFLKIYKFKKNKKNLKIYGFSFKN